MRLIDADAFEKFIQEKYKDGESTDDIKDQMLFDLSYQPTAYDVEKVVQQLEEMSFEDDCGNAVLLHDAEPIIRNGGKE